MSGGLAIVMSLFLALQWISPAEDLARMEQFLGLCPASIKAAFAELWAPHFSLSGLCTLLERGILPFVSYPFLHAGPLHFAGNVLGLWIFGSRLEAQASSLRFLLFYLLVTLGAGVYECLWSAEPEAIYVGFSGAGVGVAGAYLLFHIHARIHLLLLPLPLIVDMPVLVVVLCYLMLQFHKVQRLCALGEVHSISYLAQGLGLLLALISAPLLFRRKTGTGTGTGKGKGKARGT